MPIKHRSIEILGTNSAITAAVKGELSQFGYTVVDEAAATARISNTTRKRRSRADVLKIAKFVERPPLTIAVLYTSYVDQQVSSVGTVVDLKIAGEVVSVTGSYLDEFAVSSQFMVGDCTALCMEEASAEHGSRLGHELGAILREKIEGIGLGGVNAIGEPVAADAVEQGYTLNFEGFSNDEVLKIEKELRYLEDYVDLKIVNWGHTRAEIFYTTNASSLKLNSILRRMLSELDYKARRELPSADVQCTTHYNEA